MLFNRQLSRKERIQILSDVELTRSSNTERDTVAHLQTRLKKTLHEIDTKLQRKEINGEAIAAAQYVRGQILEDFEAVKLLTVKPNFLRSKAELISILKKAAGVTKHVVLERALIARAHELAESMLVS